MDWIRKTVVFIGLSIVFLFALTAKPSPIEKVQSEKSSASFSPDSIHSSVFIQPQATSTFGVQYTTTDYALVKYFENFLVATPAFKVSTFFTSYAKQDINRCEMVSLLLFPFHFFW
ncbi:MAG TPA: hypothetical protein VF842_11120 [Flavobacterium sp.]